MICLESEIGFHRLMYVNTRVLRQKEPNHLRSSTSIHNCEIGLQPELCNNIMITGGSTLLPGSEKRMHKELALLSSGMGVTCPFIHTILCHELNILAPGRWTWVLPQSADTLHGWVGPSWLLCQIFRIRRIMTSLVLRSYIAVRLTWWHEPSDLLTSFQSVHGYNADGLWNQRTYKQTPLVLPRVG